MSKASSLMVDVKQGQRSVSICEQGVVMWPMEEKETGSKQAHDWDRKESTASFFNPAISFARRMSLKITGNRGEGAVTNMEINSKICVQTTVMSREGPGVLPGSP